MSEINEKEAKVILKTKTGGAVYKNSSSAADIQEAKALYARLRKKISDYASKYKNENPGSIDFRYRIGQLLFDLSHAEGVTNAIRSEFLKEIEEIEDIEALMGRPLGRAGSDKRHPYLLTCLWLYTTFDKDTALSLTWSEWSELYSRPKIRDDKRVAQWVANNKSVKRENLREVFKVLTYLMEGYDLSFMDDDDVYEEMDKALKYELLWADNFEKYFSSDSNNMSAARREKATKYKEKYLRACMDEAQFANMEDLSQICETIFKSIYVDI